MTLSLYFVMAETSTGEDQEMFVVASDPLRAIELINNFARDVLMGMRLSIVRVFHVPHPAIGRERVMRWWTEVPSVWEGEYVWEGE